MVCKRNKLRKDVINLLVFRRYTPLWIFEGGISGEETIPQISEGCKVLASILSPKGVIEKLNNISVSNKRQGIYFWSLDSEINKLSHMKWSKVSDYLSIYLSTECSKFKETLLIWN